MECDNAAYFSFKVNCARATIPAVTTGFVIQNLDLAHATQDITEMDVKVSSTIAINH